MAKVIRSASKIAYFKKYYQENKETILNTSRRRYKAKRDLIRAQAKRRWLANYPAVILDRARQRARAKGVPFSIGKEDIVIPTHCPVFGMPLERASGSGAPKPNSPSLDRITPELGYVPGNVMVISYKANCMKNNATSEELVAFANWVLKEKLKNGK